MKDTNYTVLKKIINFNAGLKVSFYLFAKETWN